MRAMIVAGVMSGTSADGIDVAICRISADKNGKPRINLIGSSEFPYTVDVRATVLGAMNAEAMSVADMSRLNWRLGTLYGEAVAAAATQAGVKVALIGCHGQTVYHQAIQNDYLGAPVRATWQIGEASAIAELMRCPVISDFRPADLAAGGQGAPLVPMLDVTLFGHKTRNRILQNIGGIGNLTAIPASSGPEDVLAFDTGPGNMVIDGCMGKLYGRAFDCGGATAVRGRVIGSVVSGFLKSDFFLAQPPKSCGREEFGAAFLDQFMAVCKAAGGRNADIVATATALTADSVFDAYQRFVWAHLGQKAPLAKGTDFVVAGGGSRNLFLMDLLRERFQPIGVKVLPMDDLGIPAQAKEAVAFALLAWLTFNGKSGNVKAATGAARGVVLGKTTHG